MRRLNFLVFLIVAGMAVPVNGADSLQWSGFALFRHTGSADGSPFYDDGGLSGQLQAGVDWIPSMTFSCHLHAIARTEDFDSRRGLAGLTQAYFELNVPRGQDRIRVLGGAFFLPTSRENVDALWESPYTITPSALNSWFGEEFRPIGIDASYTIRRTFTIGGTVFRGNDTLGSFPADRGWALRDHWALLGEHLFVYEEIGDGHAEPYYTSVSAENDGRLGWSVRARWQGQFASAQFTHIDNNSDGLEYGQLLNWDTQFDLVSADYTRDDWTLAAEYGWGPTTVVFNGQRFPSDLSTYYLLASRRFNKARISVRGDWWSVDDTDGQAVTAAFFWSPRGPWRGGLEVTATDDDTRALVEARYHFSSQ